MQDKNEREDLFEILDAFGLNKTQASVLPIKAGLINTSYRVSDTDKDILLQRINLNVFKSPSDVVDNYYKIWSFLDREARFFMPAPILTQFGKLLFADKKGEPWRAFEFIDNTYSPVTAGSPQEAYETALCFGNFTHCLKDFDASSLKVIIARFHDLGFRFAQFEEALSNDLASRRSGVTTEIRELVGRKNLVRFYEQLTGDSQYKQRVMHTDAKISNVLFDKLTGKVVCPCDFDTANAGYFFSDLGDMIRSMASTTDENDPRPENVDIRKDFYKAILEGYFESLEDDLTAQERKNIHNAGRMMTYMQALRFMTDHLNGDIYYRIEHEGQNLERARNQLALLKRLESI